MQDIQRLELGFREGLAEIFVAAILLLIVNAFTSAFSSVSMLNPNWDILTTYMEWVFIISFIGNLIKGIIFPLDAFVNLLGMILGLIIAGAIFWQIAQGAVIELVLYIIAAFVGIIIGLRFVVKSQNSRTASNVI